MKLVTLTLASNEDLLELSKNPTEENIKAYINKQLQCFVGKAIKPTTMYLISNKLDCILRDFERFGIIITSLEDAMNSLEIR